MPTGSRGGALNTVFPSGSDGSGDETAEVVPNTVLEAVFGNQAELAVRYHDLLATQGVEWGLLGPRETGRLWSRHILNCAAVRSIVPADANIVDVGSGAGLPGIPLALARPDLHVTLLDSLLRRVRFLELAVGELGLADQVTVVRARAEQYIERYDVVVARAVAPLWRLVEWCGPLGQRLVALKGESAEAEVAEAAPMLEQRGLTARIVRLDDSFGGLAIAVEVVQV